MTEMYILTVDYKEDGNKDTMNYNSWMKNAVKRFNEEKIFFSCEPERVNKELIKKFLDLYLNVKEYRDDSIKVTLLKVSHSGTYAIEGVSHANYNQNIVSHVFCDTLLTTIK